MNKIKKFGLSVLGSVTALFAPVAAMAQTYEYDSQIGTTTEVLRDVAGDVLLTVVVIIGIVAGLWVLIVGVKWGFKKIRKGMNGSF